MTKFKQLKSWQKGGVIGFAIALLFVIILSGVAFWLSQDSPDGKITFLLAFLVSAPVYIVPATGIGILLGWMYGKFHSKLLIILVLLVLIVAPVVVLYYMATSVERFCGSRAECSIPATIAESQASPSGHYVLEVTEGKDTAHYLRFHIISTTEVSEKYSKREKMEAEFASEDKFYTRHRTYIMWDDERDRVWVYSGDVGTFFWDKVNTDSWKKHVCVPEGMNYADPPIFFKEQIPEWTVSCFY